jgi:large subunit ribosomal protein L29
MMAKILKIRELPVAELEREVESLSEQLFRLRFQKATGQLENALKIREVRKGLARVKTVLMEKKKEVDH